MNMHNWIKIGLAATLLTLAGCTDQNQANKTQNLPELKQSPDKIRKLSVKSPDFKTAPKNLSGAVKWQEIKPGTPAFHFVIGGYETMAAAEYILQTRYNNYSGELPMMPGGRSQLPFNPDAKFDPAFVETALKGALIHLERAQKSLDKARSKDFAVNVNLAELWLDINANGKRDNGEAVMSMLGGILDVSDKTAKDSIVRFDTADADWLAAYTHMMAGSAELILATHPTEAIQMITDGRKQLEKVGAIKKTPYIDRSNDARQLDTIAAILYMLEGEVDAKRTRAALAHFQAMIKYNKAFWKQVERETDNEREWLPNAKQTSAFGGEVSTEIAEGWQDILNEVSAVLDGKKLLPYWRLDQQESEKSVGVNVNKLLKNPKSFDVVLMLQGAAFVPFIEEGEVTDMAVMRDFANLTGGRSGLFALWLN